MNFLQTGFKGKNAAWMYVIMFVVIFMTSLVGQFPVVFVALAQVDGDFEKFSKSAEKNFTDIGIDSNLYLFLMLLAFIIPFIFFVITLRGMHKKKLSWVITARSKVDWKRIFTGIAVWGFILIASMSIDLVLNPENYVWNFKPQKFFILVLVSITCIPIQTTLEELLFRGYYMQGLALWLKNRWLPLIIMSCVFGCLHGFNPEVAKLGYSLILFYIASGFFFGIVTLLDEGTELAIGMHAINNIIAALFITANWTVFQTDALYLDTSEPSIGFEMFLPIFILYPLTILFFAKKYKWSNWKEKLFGDVVKPQEDINEIGS